MRITIEPSRNEHVAAGQWRVVVEHPSDDIVLSEVVQLVSRALYAYGFSDQSIADYFRDVAASE